MIFQRYATAMPEIRGTLPENSTVVLSTAAKARRFMDIGGESESYVLHVLSSLLEQECSFQLLIT